MGSRVHVFIYGDVIGVGFRSWTVRNAKELNLSGWVKNVYPEQGRRAGDDLVEAVFEGEKEKVEKMVKRCQQGPEVAWVAKVDVKWEEPTGELEGFEVVL